MSGQPQLASNDTYCRTLIRASKLLNSTLPLKCTSCLNNGCTWCKRDVNPFCWSGNVNDLPKTSDTRYTTCSAGHATYSPDRRQSDVESKCQIEETISAGAIAALIIWAIILICCIGACCFTVVYFAYRRGKRANQVHIDSWSDHAAHGQYGPGTLPTLPATYYQPSAQLPIQVGVVLHGEIGSSGGAPYSSLSTFPDQSRYIGPAPSAGTAYSYPQNGSGGYAGMDGYPVSEYDNAQKSIQTVPLAIARPL